LGSNNNDDDTPTLCESLFRVCVDRYVREVQERLGIYSRYISTCTKIRTNIENNTELDNTDYFFFGA
jgi:hypothetical protein